MLRKILVFTLILASSAGVAGAQRNSRGSNPLELGIDGGINFIFANPTVTILSLPAQDFRLGFILNNSWEAEPRVGLNSIHSNGASLTTYQLALGLLWHPGANPTGKGVYVRPFVGMTGVSGSGVSNNNGLLGVGLGAKIPFGDHRLATRVEANYAANLGNGGNNQIGLLFGLSFFTR
jgi:hypothetical protein